MQCSQLLLVQSTNYCTQPHDHDDQDHEHAEPVQGGRPPGKAECYNFFSPLVMALATGTPAQQKLPIMLRRKATISSQSGGMRWSPALMARSMASLPCMWVRRILRRSTAGGGREREKTVVSTQGSSTHAKAGQSGAVRPLYNTISFL